MEDGNFLSCVHKVYRRSYLYGSQLFLHHNRGAYLFFLFFGFSSSVHLFQLLVYNITVNLAPSAEGLRTHPVYVFSIASLYMPILNRFKSRV